MIVAIQRHQGRQAEQQQRRADATGTCCASAVRHRAPIVSVENAIRANTAKAFVPSVQARFLQCTSSTGSKMIGYAMILSPVEEEASGRQGRADDDDILGGGLARSMAAFLAGLDLSTSNQSLYEPLCHAPTGVFTETKVSGQQGSTER
ncbi:hypothetical protein DL769_000010 [Monosporascus sp. CRB-8-3]|nr:hypothetical protein DL769_000010 [Monosporascus sp. CRB-8-3]